MLFRIYCANLFFCSTIETFFKVSIFYFKDKVTLLIISYNALHVIVHLKYNVVNNRFVLKVICSLIKSIHFNVL